ncbi:MAG: hypothetical protein QXL77_01245 [Candidatus Bathyarchaeia archaeon]|nr:hypothetical protein [Candidatus Bathyarchaeota archaeon]
MRMIGVKHMCGVFGFALKKPVKMAVVFKVLQKLERHQYPDEKNPVGGYGAGVAVLTDTGEVLLRKVGKVEGSPAEHLSRVCELQWASVLVGHVRLPSPQFMETAKFDETAQPYVARCIKGLTVISAHNGNVTNYKTIREKLDVKHTFESERIELIDSEVIPHLFEEFLIEKNDPKKALEALFQTLEGANTVSLMQVEDNHLLLHFVHKGKTRGLTIWKNYNEEIVFCSRKEPLMECFNEVLEKGGFKEHVFIPWGVEANLQMTVKPN